MEMRGIDQYKCTLAMGNLSIEEEEAATIVVLIYWNKNHEEALKDEDRGGCNCSIF